MYLYGVNLALAFLISSQSFNYPGKQFCYAAGYLSITRKLVTEDSFLAASNEVLEAIKKKYHCKFMMDEGNNATDNDKKVILKDVAM